jgi:hypothetical protein
MDKSLTFEYKNWEGEIAVRKVLPIKLWWGKTKWHTKKGWLLKALDLDKKEERDFSVKDIIKFL